MKISFLFVLILIIMIVLAVRGYRLGLAGILFGAVSWVFVILLVVLAGAPLADILTEHTGIAEAVRQYFISFGSGGDIQGILLSSFADEITGFIMRIIGVILAIVIGLVVVFIFKCLFRETLNDKSFIGTASKTLGTVWGLFEGVIIGWVILGFCSIILKNSTGGELYSDINDNVLMYVLYTYNPLAGLF